MTEPGYNWKGGLRNMLKANSPGWANKNPNYTTLDEQLERYSSSKYQEV